MNTNNTDNNNNVAVNGSKPPISLDIIIHEELDQANKNSYYETVNKELKKAYKSQLKSQKKIRNQQQDNLEQLNKEIINEYTENYVESFRNYYYTSQVLSHNKSNDFFEEMIRQLHPVTKIKGPVKSILKTFCKIFVQQLAQTCLQVMQKTNRAELDSEVISDAYRVLLGRKTRNNNFGNLFGYIL